MKSSSSSPTSANNGLPPDIHQAIADLQQLELRHTDAERMKGLGNKHMANKDYDQAYQAYSAAIRLSPTGPQSHVFYSNRAAASLSLKQYEEAAADARRSVALQPSFGKAYARLGQALYFCKDYEGAVAAYEEALRHDETAENAVTWSYLAKAKAKLEKQRARQQQHQQQHSPTKQHHRQGGISPREILSSPEEEYEESPKLGGEKSRRQPSFAGVMEGLHDEFVAEQQKQVQGKTSPPSSSSSHSPQKQSPSSYSPQKKSSPTPTNYDPLDHFYRKGNFHLSRKEFEMARNDFTSALNLLEDEVQVDKHILYRLYYNRASALISLNRYEEACEDAQAAVTLFPDSHEAYSALGRSLYFLQDYEGAITSFTESFALNPDDANGQNVLDKAYLEKAKEELAKLQPSPPSPSSLVERSPVDLSTKSASPKSASPHRGALGTVPKLRPPRFVPREEAMSSTPNVPPMPKSWPSQSAKSDTFLVGPERTVFVFEGVIGIKLNRGTDGFVRVISTNVVSPDDPQLARREGTFFAGAVLREAAGVDLRRPITNVMWGDTVTLMKIAKRPITFVIAKEFSEPPTSVQEELAKAQLDEMERIMMRKPDVGGEKFVMPSPAMGEESVKVFMGRYALQELHIRDARSLADDTSEEETEGMDVEEEHLPSSKIPEHEVDGLYPAAEADEGAKTEGVDADANEPDRESSSEKQETEEIIEEKEIESVRSPVNPPSMSQADDGAACASSERGEAFHDEENGDSSTTFARHSTSEMMTPADRAVSERDREAQQLGGEILFDVDIAKTSSPHQTPINYGWTKHRWLSTSSIRSLRHCGMITKVSRGALWGEKYESLMMAVFENPNLIVLCRRPRNVAEIKRLLELPVGVKVEMKKESFWVVETVVDPAACKLRLSNWTTATSLHEREPTSENPSPQRHISCYELITPAEVLLLSVLPSSTLRSETSLTRRSSSQGEHENADEGEESEEFLETCLWETMLSQALLHSYESPAMQLDPSWRHQVILGTLHSHVVTADDFLLRRALEAISDAAGKSKNFVDIDVLDECGFTALHYACSRRNHAAVNSLG